MADLINNNVMWPNYAANNVKAATSTQKDSTLGKDDFLKILIAQLKNQDPMQPLQDKEFIAQMAQFSSVEQLTNMAGEMKLLRQSLGFASSLIGKQVTWAGFDQFGQDAIKEGVVDAITFKDGNQYAKVGGEEVSLDKLLSVENPEN